MSIISIPFGFMGSGNKFDPTLRGTISPYFWYDFTDSDTMTLAGTTITEIDSKGSNTGSLAKGTSATKYTTAYNNPEFNTTFSTFNGDNNKNSCLARKYGTGDYLTDGNFGADTANTSFFFFQPAWEVSQTVYVASWKGDTPTVGSQPEEWGMVMLADGTGNPQGGATVYQTNSPTTKNLSVLSDSLANSFTSSYWSYDGAPNIGSGGLATNQLLNYHCSVIQNTATGGTHADMVVGRNTTDVSVAFPGPKNTGGSSLYEGFAIGGRARDNYLEGALFNIKHCVIYESTLTNTQITNVIASYNNAYPADELNT